MGSLHLRQDEDLALFKEMRARERRKFLQPSREDLGTSPSSTDDDELLNNVSATTPSRKGNELLVSDSGKNDYNWLVTPPGTPLFPSLDQDVPIIKLSQRRVLTRSVSASRTSRLSYPQDPCANIYGGNPSPRRPSTASSTSSTVITGASRGRPSSPSVGSSPTLRPSSPCRPSTPNGRTSSRGASRSLTPTMRGNNTSPSPASRAGPTSKQIRGKSLSPKLRPWEPSIPGFSGEPPPNLRTTLSNRSIQRGAPQGTSRPGKLQAKTECNQSQWPTHSRDVSGSWSLSNSQDQNSSITSKGSVISCDDDVEMAESVFSNSTKGSSMQVLDTLKITANPGCSTGRCILPAKRHTRPAIPSLDTLHYTKSSTRKPFHRPVGQRRSSESMFRPLMSSAPATSFYSSRPAVSHHGSANPPPATSLPLNRSVEHDMQLVLEEENNGEDMQAESADHGSTSSESSQNPVGADGHHIDALHNGNVAVMGLQVSKYEDFNVDTSEGLQATQLVRNGPDFGEPQVSSRLWKKERTPSSRFLDKGIHSQDEMSCIGMPVSTDPNNSVEVDMKDACTLGQEHIREQHKHAASSCSEVAQTISSKQHGKCNKMVVVNQVHLGSTSYENGRVDIPTTPSNCAVLQSGPLRHLSDMGSFRKQSCNKTLSMRFYDSIINSEKSVSDLSTGSRGMVGSSASNWGDHRSERSLVESGLDAVEPTFQVEASMPMAMANSSRAPSVEKSATYQEKEGQRDLPGSTAMEDASCFVNQNDLLNKVGQDANCGEEVSSTVKGLAGNHTTKEVSLQQRDALSILGLCTAEILSDEDVGVQHPPGIADTRAVEVDKAHSRCTSATFEDEKQDGKFYLHEPAISHLKRNVTFEEATDTILFCSSIIHELVYKAASIAVEDKEKEEACARPSRREFVALFGFSGSDYKSKERGKGVGTGSGASRKRSVVRQSFSQVQRQRMVHQQTMAVTMRHSPTERIENAVMGTNAEMPSPVARTKGKKQGKKAAFRCRCCIM